MNRADSFGISFPGLLTILFIGLKLTEHIAWSWIWVLSPLWIPALIFLALFLVIFVYGITADHLDRKKRK